MAEYYVGSFINFHQVISKYDYRVYLFRGVSKLSYRLKPKIGRIEHAHADFYTFESTLMKQFKKLSTPYLNKSPENEWEWLAIAQHHGLSTRLLDWSRNPMVAAYFAICSDYNCESVIYAMDSSQFDENIDYVNVPYIYDSALANEVKIFEPNHITSRIIAQNGLFTFHSDPMKPLDAIPGIVFDKIIIKRRFKKELKKTLDVYGINKAALFPGLDGITEYLEWFNKR